VGYYNVYETQLLIFGAHDFNIVVMYNMRILNFKAFQLTNGIILHLLNMQFNIKKRRLAHKRKIQKFQNKNSTNRLNSRLD